MKKLFKISAGLLIVDLVLLTAWIAARLYCNPASFSPIEISPFIVTAGVLAALITLSTNQLREESEEYLENATDLLSKAYKILESSRDDHGRPKNSRLNWLTAARLIRTAESIGDLLTLDSHRRILREQKEYWRGRIRDLISPTHDGFPREYYAENAEKMMVYGDDDQEPLSERSLVVLYRFVKWPEGLEDPLKNDGSFTDEEIEHMAHFGPKQLGRLLQEVRQIRSNKE